jgi:hypothetical protein
VARRLLNPPNAAPAAVTAANSELHELAPIKASLPEVYEAAWRCKKSAESALARVGVLIRQSFRAIVRNSEADAAARRLAIDSTVKAALPGLQLKLAEALSQQLLAQLPALQAAARARAARAPAVLELAANAAREKRAQHGPYDAPVEDVDAVWQAVDVAAEKSVSTNLFRLPGMCNLRTRVADFAARFSLSTVEGHFISATRFIVDAAVAKGAAHVELVERVGSAAAVAMMSLQMALKLYQAVADVVSSGVSEAMEKLKKEFVTDLLTTVGKDVTRLSGGDAQRRDALQAALRDATTAASDLIFTGHTDLLNCILKCINAANSYPPLFGASNIVADVLLETATAWKAAVGNAVEREETTAQK